MPYLKKKKKSWIVGNYIWLTLKMPGHKNLKKCKEQTLILQASHRGLLEGIKIRMMLMQMCFFIL